MTECLQTTCFVFPLLAALRPDPSDGRGRAECAGTCVSRSTGPSGNVCSCSREVPNAQLTGSAPLSAYRLTLVFESGITRVGAVRDTPATMRKTLERRRNLVGATPAVVERDARLRMLRRGNGAVKGATRLSSELQQSFEAVDVVDAAPTMASRRFAAARLAVLVALEASV